MRHIAAQHKSLKKTYDGGGSPLEGLRDLSAYCIRLLHSDTQTLKYDRKDEKEYFVFEGENKSRPINERLWIPDTEKFSSYWDSLLNSFDEEEFTSTLGAETINRTIYTAIISFAACYDVWKNKSRKTPGTHFEVLLGSILSQFLPGFTRAKFVPIPNQSEKISTDIVFDNGEIGFIIPAKITTRERIVQPYAHQRILDSVFGSERYKSILLCVSETQRDDDNQLVNDICVPGTVKLYQAHLSSLSGIYYLDPPTRYCAPDITELVAVSDYGQLLTQGFKSLVE